MEEGGSYPSVLVTIHDPGPCGGCGKPAATKGLSMECPSCGGRFCSACFTSNPGSDGSTILCRFCSVVLRLPQPADLLEVERLFRSLHRKR